MSDQKVQRDEPASAQGGAAEVQRDPHDLRGQIEVLHEAGEDGGGWMGYWCRGHHDPADFAYAANYDYGFDDPEHRRHIRPHHVKQVWWRKVPIAGEPGYFRFMAAKSGARGAFPATVADIDGWLHEQRAADARRWEDHGRRLGVEAALRFCADRFGAEYVDLVHAWNASRAPTPQREEQR